MKREIIELTAFSKSIDQLIKKQKITSNDFQNFIKSLAERPDQGDLIKGSGGIRKVRLKSSSGGKRGGFRVCYFHFSQANKLFLLLIYAKNEKENINSEEREALKDLAEIIKRGYNE